jgi:hypothetical protein
VTGRVSPAAIGRRTLLVAALGGAGAGLTGCVGLAATGPVERGGPLTGGSNEIPITVFARLPDPDAGPAQIVEGFLEASALPGPSYATARAYLTARAARTWNPGAAVTVYDGTALHLVLGPLIPRPVAVTRPRPTATGRRTPVRAPTAAPAASGTSSATATPLSAGTTMRIEAPLVGALDRRGAWSRTGTVSLPLTLQLVTVDGQWRIDNPPSGLIVSQDDFTRFWSSYRLLYPDPGGDVLVPDPVYLPDRGAPATSLVQALLGGPSAWLAPVVRRTVPNTTTLAGGTVTLANGLATVDLGGVGRLDTQERTLLAAQLVQTLAQLNTVTVTAVSVVIDGAPLAIAGVAEQEPVDSWARYSADVLAASTGDLSVLRSAAPASASPTTARAGVARSGTSVARGAPGSLRAVALPATVTRAARPSAIATDPQSARVVLVDAGQTRLMSLLTTTVTARPQLLATGVGMLRPQIDRQGLVWVLDIPGGVARLRVVGPGAEAAARLVPVDTGSASGAQLRRVLLARDGQRAAVVVESGGQDLLLLQTVDRSADIALADPRYVFGPAARIFDLAWADAVTVLALVRASDGGVSVVQVDCDGSSPTSLGSVPTDSVTLTAGPARPAVVGTSHGVVLVQLTLETPQWKAVDTGYAPSYPG